MNRYILSKAGVKAAVVYELLELLEREFSCKDPRLRAGVVAIRQTIEGQECNGNKVYTDLFHTERTEEGEVSKIAKCLRQLLFSLISNSSGDFEWYIQEAWKVLEGLLDSKIVSPCTPRTWGEDTERP